MVGMDINGRNLSSNQNNFKKIKHNNKHSQPSFKGCQIIQDKKGKQYYEFTHLTTEKDVTLQAFSKDGYAGLLEPTKVKGDMKIWRIPVEYFTTVKSASSGKKGKIENHNRVMYSFKEGNNFVNDNYLGAKGRIKKEAVDGNQYFIYAPNANKSQLSGSRSTYEYLVDSANVIDNPEIPFLFKDGSYSLNRNQVVTLGGTIDSLAAKLDKIRLSGASLLKTTPIQGDDQISNHGYWATNQFQVSPTIGGEKAYMNLVDSTFQRSMGIVDDIASVNEAIEGIHINDIIKYGADSKFSNWVKVYNFPDHQIGWGVLPNNDEVYKHFEIGVINSPFKLDKNNKVVDADYDPKLPTKIQLYDKRLVTEEEHKALQNGTGKVIRSYSKKTVDGQPNLIRATGDSVQPLSLEVSPEQVKANLVRYASDLKKVDKSEISKKEYLCDLGNSKLVKINQSAGIDLWDGNKDIILLNFKNPQVLDYTAQVMYDRVDKVAKRQKEYISSVIAHQIDQTELAQKISNLPKDLSDKQRVEKEAEIKAEAIFNAIDTLSKKGVKGSDIDPRTSKHVATVLPEKIRTMIAKKEITKEHILNILNGEAKGAYIYGKAPKNIMQGIMNYHLDKIEFPREIAQIIAGPDVKKLANNENTIGVRRYEFKQNHPESYAQMSDTYKKMDTQVYTKMDKIVKDIIKSDPELSKKLLDKKGDLSKTGRKLFDFVADDLTKALTVKAIANMEPDVKSLTEGKALTYDIDELHKNSFHNILYPTLDAKSHEAAAKNFVDSLNEGLNETGTGRIDSKFKKKLANHLKTRLSGMDADHARVAKFLAAKSELGLGIRIDAAKNVANWDSVSGEHVAQSYALKNMTKVFSDIIPAINKDYPHTYTITELTAGNRQGALDRGIIHDSQPQILNRIGATTQTNFADAFLDLSQLFGGGHEPGRHYNPDLYSFIVNKINGNQGVINDSDSKYNGELKVDHGWGSGMLKSNTQDSVNYSHTLVGAENPDKARPIHLYSLDLADFYVDESNVDKYFDDFKKLISDSNSEKSKGFIKALDTQLAGKYSGDKLKLMEQVQPALVMRKALNESIDEALPKGSDSFIKESLKKSIDDSPVEIDASIKKSLKKSIDELPKEIDATAIKKSLKKSIDEVLSKETDATIKETFKEILTKSIDGALPKQGDMAMNQRLKKSINELFIKNNPINGDDEGWLRQFSNAPFETNWEKIVSNLGLKKKDLKDIEIAVHEKLTEGAFKKYQGVEKLHVTLPGNPTISGGSDLGAMGYEVYSKNLYLQNRNAVTWGYADEKNPKLFRPFIAEHKEKVDEIFNWRNNPKLSPLGDGDTSMLHITNPDVNQGIAAIHRVNKERDVIVLYNTTGLGGGRKDFSSETTSGVKKMPIDGVNLEGKALEGTLYKDLKGRTYKINQDGVLKFLSKDGKLEDISIDDSTLVLYRKKAFTSDDVEKFMTSKEGKDIVASLKAGDGKQMPLIEKARASYEEKLKVVKAQIQLKTEKAKEYKQFIKDEDYSKTQVEYFEKKLKQIEDTDIKALKEKVSKLNGKISDLDGKSIKNHELIKTIIDKSDAYKTDAYKKAKIQAKKAYLDKIEQRKKEHTPKIRENSVILGFLEEGEGGCVKKPTVEKAKKQVQQWGDMLKTKTALSIGATVLGSVGLLYAAKSMSDKKKAEQIKVG